MSDLLYLIIPNAIIFWGILVTLLYQIIYYPQQIIANFLVGLSSLLFLYLLYLATSGRGIGLGDVKYSFLMGLLLGFPQVIIAFYLAFLTGAGIAIILLLLGRVRFGQRIAFGPFLVLSTIISLLWKEKLLILFLRFLF